MLVRSPIPQGALVRMVVASPSSWSGWPTTCFFAELTRLRITPTISKHQCRGSSLVERRPEKAGVASSILAPGTMLTATAVAPSKPRGDVTLEGRGIKSRLVNEFFSNTRRSNPTSHITIEYGASYSPHRRRIESKGELDS